MLYQEAVMAVSPTPDYYRTTHTDIGTSPSKVVIFSPSPHCLT